MASYKEEYKDKCWYEDCACEDIYPADCDSLRKENNEGIGRYACATQNQDCYDKNFFKRAFQKIACQFEHVIQNICAIWDLLQCITEYLKAQGNQGYETKYYRHTGVEGQNFYKPIMTRYAINLYKDSEYGWDTQGGIDDGKRGTFDQDMHCYIRWCADGNELNPAVDNTMTFVVRTSGEGWPGDESDMVKQRGIHWQMTGLTDGAMPCSDTIVLPKGQNIVIEVIQNNTSSGTFRVHNIKVEYHPIAGTGLPDCLKTPEVPKKDCNC